MWSSWTSDSPAAQAQCCHRDPLDSTRDKLIILTREDTQRRPLCWLRGWRLHSQGTGTASAVVDAIRVVAGVATLITSRTIGALLKTRLFIDTQS